jgi:[protein-PII] uridylyltransferase
LSVSANDRTGLLYAIAKILAEHHISLHTARINTLGERIEDVFLLDGHNLSKDSKIQVQLETEILDTLAV